VVERFVGIDGAVVSAGGVDGGVGGGVGGGGGEFSPPGVAGCAGIAGTVVVPV